MNRRRRFLRLAAISAATLLPAASAAAADSNVNVSTPPRGAESCSQLRVDFDGVPAFAAEERLTISRLDAPVLKIRLTASSGLSVRAGTGPDYSVRVCKAAASARDLARLSVTVHSGELAFHSPETDRGLVFLIVSAPPDAALDLEASNGPLSIADIAGRVTARSANGPITFENCSGEGEAFAANGPISLTGGGGNYRLTTENGPISVELTGRRWHGPGLAASATNGPLALKVPEGYASGASIETAGHSPVHCASRACRDSRRTSSDGRRRIELGEEEPVIRLSTVNGPVSVEAGGEED